jgi:hypothetical protein
MAQQPITLNIVNHTPAILVNVEIFNPVKTLIGKNAANLDFTVSSGVPGVELEEIIADILFLQKPIEIFLARIYSNNDNVLNKKLTVTSRDIKGNAAMISLKMEKQNYSLSFNAKRKQAQQSVADVNGKFMINRLTSLSLDKLLPGEEISFLLFF